jgi:hypothetical protein
MGFAYLGEMGEGSRGAGAAARGEDDVMTSASWNGHCKTRRASRLCRSWADRIVCDDGQDTTLARRYI